MENVTVLETVPGNVTPDQNKRYMAALMDLLPKTINKDPEFQMKFYVPGKNETIKVDEIPE